MGGKGMYGFEREEKKPRPPINRRKAAAFLIVVLVVSGFLGYFFIIPAVSTHFHYEGRWDPSNPEGAGISLLDLEDTNITVMFIDDPTLWYRIDVVHYSPGRAHHFDARTWGVTIDGITSRVKDILVVLGNATSYGLLIIGDNLNTTITYDNGALVGGARNVRYDASGIFRLRIAEDVNRDHGGMQIDVVNTPEWTYGDPLVLLDINLPEGMNGRLSTASPYVSDVPDVIFVHNEWPRNYYGYIFTTTSITDPMIDIETNFALVVAALYL